MNAKRSVTTAVIPVAGMGTRFLPATKVLPKELLPIIDKPIIHHIVQEAVNGGIKNIVFVTSRPKVLIEDYFDSGDYASLKLKTAGKEKLISEALELSEKINIISVRQYEPRGLGHAILQAEPIIGRQNFAVLLGDDIVVSDRSSSAMGECLRLFESKPRGSAVGVLEVAPEETSSYGIVGLRGESEVETFVEKPTPAEAPSRWALPGRYVFEPEIFDALRETKPGKNGEIQLTDGMLKLLQSSPFFAHKLSGERFDTGSKLGYIIANVAFALQNPEIGPQLQEWLTQRLR
ncbi:MAG TPA: UTP--glucose-1-phosphate uridylyltransferase [Bdellovibrionota bacterium]|nr:UTP--glucose-1-phosphate uridylyltransferase [Bdellovibrionota bacterium]